MNPPIRLYMSMSLDGFITGPDDRPGQELGRDGGRLFNWMDDRMSDGPSGQVLLRAGLLDEMEIHLVPVLLGEGRRLFDSLGPGHIELELVRRVEGRDVTHLRYRVKR